ncbi:HAD-IA family hydrolase [Altererythrobacter aestuarii]|uniref:HAD-IA family hydrolase n=1 Tax=Alteraurantiacibacter aestuarii TaxID=650004 RepID=A0A844ZNH6_9SPHN|nr:HAD-IA family hydrolase [Alteraurantiacibacter aestuarii]
MRLAVFDCDGTLSDGQAAVCRSMEIAFSQAGLPAPDLGQVRRIVGLSLPQAIRSLAPGAAQDQQNVVLEAYKQAFRAARLDGSLHEPLFPGMAELVRSLHGRGWMLGVATGKSDRGLKSTLATNGLLDFFTTLQTADRHPSKPHPSMLHTAMEEALARPENTVMIGDTVFDMECAVAAGTGAIGVAWGYHEADELRSAGATAIAASARELEELLDG